MELSDRFMTIDNFVRIESVYTRPSATRKKIAFPSTGLVLTSVNLSSPAHTEWVVKAKGAVNSGPPILELTFQSIRWISMRSSTLKTHTCQRIKSSIWKFSIELKNFQVPTIKPSVELLNETKIHFSNNQKNQSQNRDFHRLRSNKCSKLDFIR